MIHFKIGTTLDQEVDLVEKFNLYTVSLHDVKRLNDLAQDVGHGKRVAEFLRKNPDIYPDLDKKTRDLARQIMAQHVHPDDYTKLSPEAKIFKDVDAFVDGPDWDYMRQRETENIDNIVQTLEYLSSEFIENGAIRANSVILAIETLGLFKSQN
jgi:hypothetical protein